MAKEIVFVGITDEHSERIQRFFVAKAGNIKLYPPAFEIEKQAATIVFSNAYECDDKGNPIAESRIELAIVLPKKFIDVLAVANGSNSWCSSDW